MILLRRTPESDWLHRSLGLPFGVDFANATGDPPTGASAAHRQCVPLAAPMNPLNLQRWMAFGGTDPTYDVTVTQVVDGDLVPRNTMSLAMASCSIRMTLE